MNLFLKYIKKIILSILSIILLSFAIKMIWINKTSYYFKNKKIKNYCNIDIGIFGHSQTLGGLDEKILNENQSNFIFENYSITGAPLFYNACLIEYSLSKNPKMEVILEIGSNNVDQRGTVKGVFHENSFFHFENFFSYILTQDLHFSFNKKLYDSMKYLFTSTFNFPTYNFTGFQPWESKFEIALNRFKEDSIKTNEKYNSKINLDYEINRLIEVIEANPSNDFLLIRLPEHDLYQKILSNSNRYEEVICRLTNFKNVNFRDFVNYQLKEDDFRDLYHLSNNGALKFSKYFISNFSNFKE
jgi:hypothetical protein